VRYGAATSKANDEHLLNYMVMQQLDRLNRLATLEVWEHSSELHGLAGWRDDYKLRYY
jgi:hypothetical protein